MLQLRLIFACSFQLASAWFDWLWAPAELKFDVSDVPPLVSQPEIFPKDYQEAMTWGTYRPGVYFGVKGRHEASFLFGLAWASLDGKILRHECESGELQAFGWKEHDGQNYGHQSIEDQKLGHELLTTFVKEDPQTWHTRIETMPLGKAKAISLLPYLGIEASSTLRVEDGEWSGSSGAWQRSFTISGEDPVAGPFNALMSFRSSAVSKPHFHHASARVQHEAGDAPSTGVWDAKRHLKEMLRRPPAADGKKAKHAVLPDNREAKSNFVAAQLLGNATVRVDFHISFRRPISDVDAESKRLDDAVASRSQEFKRRLADAFELSTITALDGNLSVQTQRDGVALAVASLLGGLGNFRGKLLVKTSEGKESRLPESSVLFSAVPSRSFFPRGFLWDEGFHGLLLCRWNPRIFLDVLAHWLDLQQSSGWIPREVPLGAEQEVRVPSQFLPQDPGVANPPSLLLPLAFLLRASTDPKLSDLAISLANRAGLADPADFRKMLTSFGAAALPRLVAWYAFLDRSQKSFRSSQSSQCYRWFGRTAAHCLASGLDDYPRGLYVNDDECHLDLHSWMLLFARTLATLCNQLSLDSSVKSTFCIKPDWTTRARKLNETLFDVFVHDQVLADYIGRQPVSSGSVQVLPPWRSDGRCGPQFPVGKAPGECDPYGGATCCSPSGWCGGSPDFCDCPGCRRFLKLEERTNAARTALVHSPHLGYVSLFPLVLGHLSCDHPYAARLLRALQPPGPKSKAGELWSAHGVLSLSSKDKLFRTGEDYWRGKIWGNLNYLTISALQRCASESQVKDLAEKAFRSLKSGFVETVLGTLERQRFFMENFDPKTGEGRGAAPFTGWTTLVALIIVDMPLELDFALASEPRSDL